MNYAVIIERGADGGFGARAPDLPGCAATGETIEQVKALIKEARAEHVGRLRRMGRSVPDPTRVSSARGRGRVIAAGAIR